MEKEFDFYNRYESQNDMIYDKETQKVVNYDNHIYCLKLNDNINKKLLEMKKDRVSQLLSFTNYYLYCYDFNSNEINELYENLKSYLYNHCNDNIKNDELIINKEIVSCDLPIKKLNLSPRSYNALKNNNINTLQELLKYNRMNLMHIRNLGSKSVREILQVVDKYKNTSTNTSKEVENNLISDKCNISYDTPIEKFDISVKVYNSLKLANIKTYGDLINLNLDDLNELKSIGKKTISNIEKLLEDLSKGNGLKTDISDLYLDFSNGFVEDGKIYTKNKEVFIDDINLNVMGITYFEFLELNNYHKLSDILLDHKFIKRVDGGRKKYIVTLNEITDYVNSNAIKINNSDYLYTLITKIIKKANIKGLKKEELINTLNDKFGLDAITYAIESLNDENNITEYNDILYYNYPSIIDFLYELPSSREKDIFTARINGLVLSDIGNKYNLTRERVRQLQEAFIKKYIELNNVILNYFKEDKYKFIYEKYCFTSEQFTSIFSEPITTYYYLNMRYKKGNKSLSDAEKDENIDDYLKNNIRNYLVKDCIEIGGDLIVPKNVNIVKQYISKYCNEKKNCDQIYKEINEYLEANSNNVSFKNDLRTFKNSLYKLDYVVCSLGQNVRFYDFCKYDFDRFLDILNVESYNNMLFSSKYFFDKYSSLMEEYNILDYYELHNILKKLYIKKETNIKFLRMPIIEVGTFDSKNYAESIIKEYENVKTSKLCKIIENETGHNEAFIRQTILPCIANYRVYDQYVYKEKLPIDRQEFIKSLLTGYICFKEVILKKYNENFPNDNLDYLPMSIVNECGYNFMSKVLVKKPYNIKTYINKILIQENEIKISDYSLLFKYDLNLHNFENLLKNRVFLRYDNDTFINIKKFEEKEITKEDIEEFSKNAIEFINGEYFNYHYLKKKGFKSKLDDLQYENIFYDSIFKYTNGIKYVNLNGKMVLKSTDFNITRGSFLKSILNKYQVLSSKEFINILQDEYGINIPLFLLKSLIKCEDVYFDKYTDKFYNSYELYLTNINE